MNRIWWATISGLILGGVLFGMMQRGCESTADPSMAMSPLDSVSMLAAATAPTAPISRLPESLLAQAEPSSDLRSTFGSITSAIPRPQINAGADGARAGRQQLSPRGSVEPEFASAMQLARQRDELRAQALRERAARLAGANSAVQDARRQAAAQQQRSLVTIGAAGEQLSPLQGQELIRSRLLQQIRRERQRGLSVDPGSPRGQSPNSNGGDPLNPDSPGANPNDAPNAGPGAAVTQNSVPGGGAGTVLPNAGTNFTNPGATTPLNPTPIGDTSTPAAGDGAPTGTGVTNTTGDGGIAPPPPFIIPPTGTGNTDGGATPPSNEPAVIARWVAVETDSACSDLLGTRTNDLFVGFSAPLNLQIVTSAPPLSLNIQGGSFLQDPLGANEQPSLGALAVDSCVAFDSYLAIGDERNLLMPVAPDDPLDWGASLSAVWGTPVTTPFGVAGVQNPARFGDDRYYVRIGRFTATGNPDFVGGTVLINALNPATFSFTTEIVPVLFDAADWAVEGAGGPILSTLAFDDSSAVGGIVTGATVTISSPAPDGGVEVGLNSSSAHLSVPASVMIPPGQTSVRFNVQTSVVDAPAIATLYAFLNGKVVSASVTLQAPVGSVLDTLAIAPEIVRGGLAATGTVTLAAPAPIGGVVVNLSSDDLSIANVPPNVLVAEGQTQATFQIQTASTTAPKSLFIWAKNGEQVRTASLTVTIASDLTGDGLVDAADLAQLLANWNTNDPNADINGDGVVNAADLAILLVNFHATSGGTPFTGAVIARWIPVAIPAQCGLPGQRSNDLYFGFEGVPAGPVVTSLGDTQLFMTGGVVHQEPPPFGSNSPPGDFVSLFPCLAYDSYLTLGGTAPLFLPGTALDVADWGSSLTAAWFTTDFGGIVIEHDPVKFGDSRFYLKIARITATEGVRIEGEFTVDFSIDGASQPSTIVPVVHCPVCWKSFDLNGDGVVDAADVNFVMAMLGTSDPLTDLNSDGIVTAADVALIIKETSTPKTKGK